MKKILTFILIALIFTSDVDAVEKSSQESALGVSPAIIESVLTPDVLAQSKIEIFNNSKFPIPIKSYARDFIVNEDLKQEDRDRFDSSEWITINPADFILQPGEHRTIEISILPDAQAEPGGHYATIYFQPLVPESIVSSDSTFLSSRIGVLAFFIVKGDMNEKAQVNDFKLPKVSFGKDVKVNTVFENIGNVHLMVKSNIEIKDLITGEKYKVEDEPRVVLPETLKNIDFVYTPKLPIGFYKITATYNYGSHNQILIKEVGKTCHVIFTTVTMIVIVLTGGFYFFIVKRAQVFLAFKVIFSKNHTEVLEKEKPKNLKQKPAK